MTLASSQPQTGVHFLQTTYVGEPDEPEVAKNLIEVALPPFFHQTRQIVRNKAQIRQIARSIGSKHLTAALQQSPMIDRVRLKSHLSQTNIGSQNELEQLRNLTAARSAEDND